MRGAPLRRIALTAAAVALAAASAGCGRDGELAETDSGTTEQTFTTPKGMTTPKATTAPKATRTAPKATTTAPKATTRTPKATTTAPRTSTTNADPPEELSRADTRLRNTAARYARARFGVRTLSANVTLHRSRRNPRWAIASGAEGRKLWVVWLRDGAVALATTDVRRFNPPAVPCDVRPAFSEPGC